MLTDEEKLSLIRQIGEANIRFSDYTDKYYLSTNLEIKDDIFLHSPCEHKITISDAIDAVFQELIKADIIVSNAYSPHRQEYRFVNGEFVELTN